MKKWLAVAALLIVAPTFAGGAQDKKPAKQRVVGIFAHPDDELFVAPALARAARDGAEVVLLYATEGDQGPGVSDMKRGAELGRVRMLEASCAASALGAATMVSLDLGDGKLGLTAHHEGSATKQLLNRLPEWLATADIIVTWGPDGGYGHADHRMVSAAVTQLVQVGHEDRPELLYPGIRSGTLPVIPQMQHWAETDPALLDVAYEYTQADLAAARSAADCHKTQFDDATRGQMMDLFHATIWQGAVHFRRALPGG